jgi:hypothetical protein
LPLTERMVLRGGYGIYYSRATGQPFLQLAAAPPARLQPKFVVIAWGISLA